MHNYNNTGIKYLIFFPLCKILAYRFGADWAKWGGQLHRRWYNDIVYYDENYYNNENYSVRNVSLLHTNIK